MLICYVAPSTLVFGHYVALCVYLHTTGCSVAQVAFLTMQSWYFLLHGLFTIVCHMSFLPVRLWLVFLLRVAGTRYAHCAISALPHKHQWLLCVWYMMCSASYATLHVHSLAWQPWLWFPCWVDIRGWALYSASIPCTCRCIYSLWWSLSKAITDALV